MKLAYLTASTAALLLSSTALLAQSEPAQNLENVYIDVGGTAVQVPVAQAAEACALDEASLQQIAQTRLAESGLDPAVVYGLGNENPDATASTDTAAAGTTTDDAAGAEALGEMGGTDSTAAADAGTTTESTGAATADASGTMESGAGSDTASADTSGTVDSTTGAAGTTGSTDTATADAGGVTGDVQNVATTAADTSGTDPMLQLAVCQVDQARATEIGIDMSGAGSMGSTGTATE